VERPPEVGDGTAVSGLCLRAFGSQRDAALAGLADGRRDGLRQLCRDAAIVPQKQIEDLRLLLAQAVRFSLYPFLRAGQRVRIRGGCLDGVEGLLTQRDKDKLVISIESIQRSLAIAIQGYEVDLI